MDESGLIRELLGFFDKGQISALLVIAAAILLTTQFLKLTMQRFYRKPTGREIHLASFASALFFGVSFGRTPCSRKKCWRSCWGGGLRRVSLLTVFG